MNRYKIKTIFAQLSVNEKLIFIGGILSIIGTMMPWYEDQDSYGGSQLYYGVSGPLYLIGIIVLLLAVFITITFTAEHFYQRKFRLPMPENILYFIAGIQSLLLIIIALSIYSDPQFGFNIYFKEMKSGLFLSILGSTLFTIGAYRQIKMREESEKTGSPFDIPDQRFHTGLKSESGKSIVKTLSDEKEAKSDVQNLTLDL